MIVQPEVATSFDKLAARDEATVHVAASNQWFGRLRDRL
jgi:hypothetical protein